MAIYNLSFDNAKNIYKTNADVIQDFGSNNCFIIVDFNTPSNYAPVRIYGAGEAAYNQSILDGTFTGNNNDGTHATAILTRNPLNSNQWSFEFSTSSGKYFNYLIKKF